MVKNHFVRHEEFPGLIPEVWAAVALVLATVQIIYLNLGLERFQAIKFIPVYNSLLMTAVVLLGGLYFDEHRSVHPVHYPIGCLAILIGVGMLAWADPADAGFVQGSDKGAFAFENPCGSRSGRRQPAAQGQAPLMGPKRG